MKVLAMFLAVAVAVCMAAPWSGNTLVEKQLDDHVEIEEIIRSHYEKTVRSSNVDTFVHDILQEKFNARNLTMYGFSWSNCAAGSNLDIKTLTITPNPISIPGSVTVNVDAAIATTITDISSVALVIKKKIFGVFIEIPCVDNFGSCTYQNICPMLAKITCPPQILKLGFTCKCPFAAKEYTVPVGTEIAIPNLPLPSFVESGDYEIKATLNSGSTVLGCYQVTASLKKG